MENNSIGYKYFVEQQKFIKEQIQRRHEQVLREIDKEEWDYIGRSFAKSLYLDANSGGFARRLLAYQQLKQGQTPVLRVLESGHYSDYTGTYVHSTEVKDLYFCTEFPFSHRSFISRLEEKQSNGNLLEEMYIEMYEHTVVREDRIWLEMIHHSTPMIEITGLLTFDTLKDIVKSAAFRVANILIGTDIWTNIVGHESFMEVLEPSTSLEQVINGYLGKIDDINIYCDAYRHPTHKVLDSNEIILVADPITHGQYTDRGEYESHSTYLSIEGKGHAISGCLSMVVKNKSALQVKVKSLGYEI